MKYGIASKRGHTINYKRYFLASKIGNKSMLINIKGVKTMLNKIRAYIWYYSKSIYALIYNKINSMLEKVGYHLIGYKVDIKAIELCINMSKSEHESLKNLHNNLALDVSDFKTRLLKLEDFELRTLKEKAEKVLSDEFVVNDERANIMGLGNRLSQTLINDKKEREEINNLVNALDEAFNYGGYANKNDIKEIVLKHINLNN